MTGPPTLFSSSQFSDLRQDVYVQQSIEFWRDRLRLQGGLRWGKLNTLRVQPISGQSR